MRSSWQLDAKWLAALAAIALVFAAGVSYTLYRLTEHDTATGAFTAIAVSALEDKVDAEEWESVRAEAAANPDAEYYVPGVNVTVTGAEIAERSVPEALELVVGRVADTLYYEGTDAAEPLFSEEPKEGAQTGGRPPARPLGGEPGEPAASGGGGGVERSLDAGPFSIFSEDTNNFFQPMVYAFALIALAPLALLALFSRRFGRLGSPALVLLVGIAPLALLATLADRVAARAAEDPVDLEGRLGQAIAPALHDLSSAFVMIAGAAGVAIVVALLAHAGSWAFSHSSPEPEVEVERTEIIVPPALRTDYVSDEGFSGAPTTDKTPVSSGSARQI